MNSDPLPDVDNATVGSIESRSVLCILGGYPDWVSALTISMDFFPAGGQDGFEGERLGVLQIQRWETVFRCERKPVSFDRQRVESTLLERAEFVRLSGKITFGG